MRKIFFTASIFALLSAAGQKPDWEKSKINGNGNIVTREISVQPFDALSATGVFELKLSQGNKEQLKIEADENLQELFEINSEGSNLKINMKKNVNFSSKKKIKVYITFRNLKSLDLNMVGNVSTDDKLSFTNLKLDNSSVGSVNLDITAQDLDIHNKSVGNMTLSGKAQNAVIRHSGVGSFKASNLIVQTMDIEASGVGSADVNAEKQLKVKDSFLGKVRNKGNATVKKKVVI
jgi:putative autotransporter adhesin-like protein